MNKKFTFMVAALLAAGSMFSTANAVDLSKAEANKYYRLIRSAQYDGVTGTAGSSWSNVDIYVEKLYLVLDANGKLTMSQEGKISNENDALWKVTKRADGIYTLENKSGKKLTYNNQDIFYTADVISNDVAEFTLNPDQAKQVNLSMIYDNDGVSEAGWGLEGLTHQLAFDLVEAEAQNNITAQELNSVQGGKGFVFAYPSSEQTTIENDILTGRQLMAVEVSEDFTVDGKTVPAGIYFATSVSADLKLTKESVLDTKADKASQLKAFFASEFIAVDPSIPASTTNWNGGVGYTLKTVAGSDLSFDATTKGSTVAVSNACFAVAEPDSYTKTNQYTLAVKSAKLEAKAGDNHTEVKNISIGIRTVDGKKRLTTHTEAAFFKTQATATSAIIDATKLLNTDKTPAIYAIKVLSGDAKDQYLTNGLYAMPSVDVNDPSNQYVITAVDKKTNKVTFKNRVSNSSFVVSFYGNPADLNYTLVAANPLNVNYAVSEGSSEVKTSRTDLNAETVELIKVTPESKYDGYVNVDVEDYKMFTFSVAPYVGSSNVSNMFVNDKDAVVFDSEEEATQLILTGKKETLTLNDFVSLEGDEVKSFENKKDTVAVPSYNISVYDPAILVDNENGKSLKSDATAVTETVNQKGSFAIKKYQDGSVFLVSGSTVKTFNPAENGTSSLATLSNPIAYLNRSLVTIMNETESASVSLEAKSQHVSMMETVAGGYVTADVNNDAIVKGAEAAAVLWLDTTKTEATVPTFYISQGGKFLYNAADSISATSTDYKVPGTSTVKLIFKKAELLNSDTLKTTVAGREVLVADKDNKLQNVVKGIENFQYQILKAKEENEYVIRQVKADGTKYVQATNGYLTLTGNAEDAMHVVVESQAAPTSNENVVVASEVKVVANNGSIVVKNAAGKNVVVSTILGQVVANEVLTSDNATINVPAGIVVVAVDGESFKVSVK